MDVDVKDMIYFMVMYYVICMLDICELARSLILCANSLAAAYRARARAMCVPQSAV